MIFDIDIYLHNFQKINKLKIRLEIIKYFNIIKILFNYNNYMNATVSISNARVCVCMCTQTHTCTYKYVFVINYERIFCEMETRHRLNGILIKIRDT